MACHPDQTDKLKNASLSCIQRLVSFRLLKGEPTASFPDVTAAPSPNPANAQLTPTTTSAATAASASGRVTIDEIVLAISECFEGPLTEDNLQLSILKVSFPVHFSLQLYSLSDSCYFRARPTVPSDGLDDADGRSPFQRLVDRHSNGNQHLLQYPQHNQPGNGTRCSHTNAQ